MIKLSDSLEQIATEIARPQDPVAADLESAITELKAWVNEQTKHMSKRMSVLQQMNSRQSES